MKNKLIKILVNGVLFSLVPAVCTYLGQSSNLLDWLQDKEYIGNSVDLELVRNFMSILAILFTFVLLTVPLICANIQSELHKNQRDMLIKHNKDILEITLKKQLNLNNCHLNVRIFVPRITFLHKIYSFFHKQIKLEYYIKNVNGLAEKDITDNLKFEVYPSIQGLVGNCYQQKAVLYDDDLKNSNEENYNLTHYQKAKTNQLRFILVCPIFNNNEEIVSIISFDSCDEIKIREEEKDKLRKLILNYTQSLYECIPSLFKAKGGLL